MKLEKKWDDELRNKHLLTLTFFLSRENQLRGGKRKRKGKRPTIIRSENTVPSFPSFGGAKVSLTPNIYTHTCISKQKSVKSEENL